MDYNAPPNRWTFGRAQQEIELSSGLSNLLLLKMFIRLIQTNELSLTHLNDLSMAYLNEWFVFELSK